MRNPGSRDWRLASGAISSAADIISAPLPKSYGGPTTFCSSALDWRNIRFLPINRRRAGVPPENFRLKNIAYDSPLSEFYGGAIQLFDLRHEIRFSPINRWCAEVPPENFRLKNIMRLLFAHQHSIGARSIFRQ